MRISTVTLARCVLLAALQGSIPHFLRSGKMPWGRYDLASFQFQAQDVSRRSIVSMLGIRAADCQDRSCGSG
jgi:hypothetical protein